MYGIKNCTTVNNARYVIFKKSYTTKKDNERLIKKVKNFDSNSIPPYWKSLKQKILCTIFVNSMWLNATNPSCIKRHPEDCGWCMDGHLKPTGFDGDSTPLQDDDVFRTTNDDYNDENPLENYYNVDTSNESNAEWFSYLYKMKKLIIKYYYNVTQNLLFEKKKNIYFSLMAAKIV